MRASCALDSKTFFSCLCYSLCTCHYNGSGLWVLGTHLSVTIRNKLSSGRNYLSWRMFFFNLSKMISIHGAGSSAGRANTVGTNPQWICKRSTAPQISKPVITLGVLLLGLQPLKQYVLRIYVAWASCCSGISAGAMQHLKASWQHMNVWQFDAATYRIRLSVKNWRRKYTYIYVCMYVWMCVLYAYIHTYWV
jgi:hypothetical protein